MRIPFLTLAIILLSTSAPSFAEVPAAKEPQLVELSLNDLQDIGIMLKNIRFMATNIYEEAARTRVKPNAAPDVPTLTTIPVKVDETQLLPARIEQLVFFLGTMEPLIRELNKEVLDTQKGMAQLVIPEDMKAALQPLWESWQKGVADMNKDLDSLLPLFDKAADNNIKIQQVAVKLFNDANDLESLRKHIFKAVQQTTKQHPGEKIMVSP